MNGHYSKMEMIEEREVNLTTNQYKLSYQKKKKSAKGISVWLWQKVCSERQFRRKYNDTIMVRLDIELSCFHQFNTVLLHSKESANID